MFSTFFKWGIGTLLAVSVMLAWGGMETVVSAKDLTTEITSKLSVSSTIHKVFENDVKNNRAKGKDKKTELSDEERAVKDGKFAELIELVKGNLETFWSRCCPESCSSAASKKEGNSGQSECDKQLKIVPSFVSEYEELDSKTIADFGEGELFIANLLASTIFGKTDLVGMKGAYSPSSPFVPAAIRKEVVNLAVLSIVEVYNKARSKGDEVDEKRDNSDPDVFVIDACKSQKVETTVITTLNTINNDTQNLQGFDLYNTLCVLVMSGIKGVPNTSICRATIKFPEVEGDEQKEFVDTTLSNLVDACCLTKPDKDLVHTVSIRNLAKTWSELELGIQKQKIALSASLESDRGASEERVNYDQKHCKENIASLALLKKQCIVQPVSQIFSALIIGGEEAKRFGFVTDGKRKIQTSLLTLYATTDGKSDCSQETFKSIYEYLEEQEKLPETDKTKKDLEPKKIDDMKKCCDRFIEDLYETGIKDCDGTNGSRLKEILPFVSQNLGHLITKPNAPEASGSPMDVDEDQEESSKSHYEFAMREIQLKYGYEMYVRGLYALAKVTMITDPDEEDEGDSPEVKSAKLEKQTYTNFKGQLIKDISEALQIVLVSMLMEVDQGRNNYIDAFSKSLSIQNLVTNVEAQYRLDDMCTDFSDEIRAKHFQGGMLYRITHIVDGVNQLNPFYCAHRNFLVNILYRE